MRRILFFICFVFFTLGAYSQSADFTFQSTSGLFCNPASIQFTQTATGNFTGFVWNFGNGATSNSPNPVISYNSAGTFKVKLIVIYEQYTLEVIKSVTINPSITASIGYDRNYICKPGIINFTGSGSGNISTYKWDFGDGSAVTTTTSNSISHNYSALGAYNAILQVTDVSGCSATTSTPINVQLPFITGSASPTSGCVPATVNFNANAQVPVNSSVSNYTWNFNDGSPGVSTTVNSTNHLYPTPGTYSPTVSILTSEGCTNSYTFPAIGFGNTPVNITTYPVKTSICGSESAVFISKATNANLYFWQFGDGLSATVSDTITQHKYFNLGIKNIKVTPFYNGCPGLTVSFQINVVGVISSFDYSNTCADRKTFSFASTCQGNISSLTWNFGDGSPGNTIPAVIHAYPSQGTFATSLTVIDNLSGCSDIYTENIYTANPSLLNNDSSVCKNSYASFSILNNYNNPAATYTWDVVGMQVGPYNSSAITVKAALTGNFNNSVVINNGTHYCPDTARSAKPVLVRGPGIAFSAPDTICVNALYNVTNISQPFLPSDTIKTCYWNFGATVASDTVYQPQPYSFRNPGTYSVKLIGIDKYGCKDSMIKTVTVNAIPFLQIVPGVDTICLGQSSMLVAFHSDSILWSPSSLVSCSTCDSVMTSPAATTKYYVTATNILNCNARDSVLVKVFSPFVAAPASGDLYVCLNDSVKLDLDPPGKKIVWSPPAGLNFINNYGPVASPAQTTTYTAYLLDSVGCFSSSADIKVHVKSLPTVNAGPDKTYPYNSTYTLSPVYSSNVSAYTWSPSYLLNCNTCPTPYGITTYTTAYTIKVTSDSGCIAKDTATIFVECKDANILMPTAFTPNGDNLNDKFFPLTRGVRSILRFSIYNREGRLVYEAKNFSPNNKAFGWDGKINKMPQSSAIFVYYIDALCDVGEKLQRRGSFILIK